MAKTESTAVNALISLVNENQGLKRPSDPAEDLFGPPKAKSVNPPRMTATMPMGVAGEVAPLPRTRSAGGTSQHKLPNVPPPNVRMSTAPPTRGQTIPPIPHQTQKGSGPIPQPIAQANPTMRGSAPPPFPRTSSPGLPPPIRNTASAPVISQTRNSPSLQPTMPKGTRPPANTPIAAPFEPQPTNAAANPFVAMPIGYPVVQRAPQHVARIDMTGDAVSAENWFEQSRAVEKFEEETFVGTAPVRRQPRTETATLVKKMIAPTIALVIVGIMIGGFIAFNGEGGRKHVAKHPVAKAEPTEKVAPATAPQPSPESANAATATAGGEQPEPPAKTEPAAKTEEPVAKTEEPAKTEPAKTEPAKTEPTKTEPAKAEPAKAEPAVTAKTEPAIEPAIAKAAPSVREVQTTRGVVKLADVRIDSKPSGATVMLVDNGKTSFLGTTPLATSLDPSRGYDVIFTIQGKPTQMAHLDPTKTPHLEMVLGKTATPPPAPAPVAKAATPPPAPAPVAKAAPAAPVVAKAAPAAVATAPAPAVHHHHTATPAATKAAAPPPTGSLADPGFDSAPAPVTAKKTEAPKVEKAAKTEAPAPKAEPAVKAPAAGTGTLMVSSKPPCEIVIDGKPTGLTTPQRAIPLPPGAHKITFVNSAQSINKTVAVSISADQTTKLVKDLIAQ